MSDLTAPLCLRVQYAEDRQLGPAPFGVHITLALRVQADELRAVEQAPPDPREPRKMALMPLPDDRVLPATETCRGGFGPIPALEDPFKHMLPPHMNGAAGTPAQMHLEQPVQRPRGRESEGCAQNQFRVSDGKVHSRFFRLVVGYLLY